MSVIRPLTGTKTGHIFLNANGDPMLNYMAHSRKLATSAGISSLPTPAKAVLNSLPLTIRLICDSLPHQQARKSVATRAAQHCRDTDLQLVCRHMSHSFETSESDYQVLYNSGRGQLRNITRDCIRDIAVSQVPKLTHSTVSLLDSLQHIFADAGLQLQLIVTPDRT